MSVKKICAVCQGAYEYCPNCSGTNVQPYMFLFDTENCNDIWEVMNAYRTNAIDATQAKEKLQKLDLSKQASFKPVWQDLLAEIEEKASPVVQVETEQEVEEPEPETIFVPEPDEPKNPFSRRKK